MSLAQTFNQVTDTLSVDWSELEFELRIEDKERYVEAAVLLAQCNAQPYDSGQWHWHLRVVNDFGHAACAATVRGVLSELDECGIRGEIRLCEMREGRSEIVHGWGRPESVRREFRQRRHI